MIIRNYFAKGIENDVWLGLGKFYIWREIMTVERGLITQPMQRDCLPRPNTAAIDGHN